MEKTTQTMFATVLGAILVLVGLIGFFNNPVLGLFGVTTLHSIVHIVSGLVLLWAGLGSTSAMAKNVNIVFGVVYLLVAVLGFLGVGFVTSLLGIDMADNLLHTLIAIVSLGVGFFA